jgi:acyl carrier protein
MSRNTGFGLMIMVREEVVSQLERVAKEQKKTLVPLSDEVTLMDTGLDSLCFAILVARLEDAFGTDPFSTSQEMPFPVTLGDLIRIYEDAIKS